MRVKPRWLAKFLARIFGYFWLPCPICGEPFAGFEWGEESESLMRTDCSGHAVCSKSACQLEAAQRNIALAKSEGWLTAHETFLARRDAWRRYG